MAITHQSTNATSGTTISSHVVTGTDPALVVKVGYKTFTGGSNVTGITWNGTEDLVQLGSEAIDGNAVATIWYLAAPTATTADVVITYTAAIRGVFAASTYSGVDQTNPFRTAATATNGGTNDSPTVDVVANSGEMVVDSLGQVSSGPDTATADHTERHNDAATGGGSDARGASQEKASSGATETMGWTMSDGDNWGIIGGALQEPAAGGPSPQELSDGVSVGDSLLGTPYAVKTDSIPITDALLGKPYAVKSDSVLVGDTVTTSRLLSLSLTDSVGVSDAQAGLPKAVPEDSIPIGDALLSLQEYLGSDDVPVSDALLTGQEYLGSDDVAVGDVLTTLKLVVQSVADSISVSDVFSGDLDALLSDDVAVGDTFLANLYLLLSDDPSIGDTMLLGLKAMLADAVLVGDAETVEVITAAVSVLHNIATSSVTTNVGTPASTAIESVSINSKV